jgi:membrane protein
MGAALAYYSLFSIAPLLLIIISVAGLFFGEDAVRGAVFDQLADLMGENGAQAIAEMLAHANQPKAGGLAAALGVFLLLFGASGVFGQLRAALDRIWRARPSAKGSGLWTWLRANLLSMGMVFAMAFLIAVSLVLSTVVATLGKWWGAYLGGWTIVAHVLDFAISFGMLTAIFALIYKVMPRAKVEWHDVWIGAATTAVLFTIGKFMIGLYLGKSSIGTSFGAFGSLAIFMVWVYYSAQIFLFGAEFTWVYAHELGSRRGEVRPPPVEEVIAVPPLPERNPMLPVPVMQIEKSEPAAQPRRTKAYEIGIAAALLAGGALGFWNARRERVPQRGSIWRRWRLTDR